MNDTILTASRPLDGHERPALARWVRIAFYPATALLTLLYIYTESTGRLGPTGAHYPLYLICLLACMLSLEWLVPLRRDWAMSKRSFLRRDLPMLVLNAVTIGLVTHAMTVLPAQAHARSFSALPRAVQAILAIVISDFVWYWVHRYSHEGTNRFGSWLWRTHSLHHMPRQVYVFMHVVSHPLNTAYVRVILLLPAALLGLKAEAIFAAAVFTGFQGLISHFNVDIRAGWLNYLFMGTELHRYHHSADVHEGRNYGAVITLWDQLFGTFEYHPGEQPRSLGWQDYPADTSDLNWKSALIQPFAATHPKQHPLAPKEIHVRVPTSCRSCLGKRPRSPRTERSAGISQSESDGGTSRWRHP